jgi:hypothetical protein
LGEARVVVLETRVVSLEARVVGLEARVVGRVPAVQAPVRSREAACQGEPRRVRAIALLRDQSRGFVFLLRIALTSGLGSELPGRGCP